MLILHFNIYSMNVLCTRDRDTLFIAVNYIPPAFAAIGWNMAILYVLENPLMEIANIVVIGFIALPEYFIADDLFPR